MRIYYPQAAVELEIIWEDFGKPSPETSQPYKITAQVKRMSVTVTDYTKANVFEIEIDAKYFPFDPRAIRSCLCAIFLEDMGALYDQSGKKKVIQPRRPQGGLDHNTMLLGFVDDDSTTYDENTRSVTFKGRDYTAIYLDAPWPGSLAHLDGTVPQIIKKIIGQLKASGDITVDVRTNNLQHISKEAFDLGLYGKVMNATPKQSYWDVIQYVAKAGALICYMELDKLVLTDPKILYNQTTALQFIYGKNVSKLEFSRKIGRMKGFNVVVKGYVGKTLTTVRIPLQSTSLDIRGKDVFLPKLGSDGKPLQGVESLAPAFEFILEGTLSQAALISYGETIFQELGRQQIEGKITTKDMFAVDGTVRTAAEATERKVDLTKLRTGAAIQLHLAPTDLSRMSEFKTDAEKTTYLESIGYPETVAPIFAKTLGRLGTPFYLKEANFVLEETGFELTIDFINQIETAGLGVPGL